MMSFNHLDPTADSYGKMKENQGLSPVFLYRIRVVLRRLQCLGVIFIYPKGFYHLPLGFLLITLRVFINHP